MSFIETPRFPEGISVGATGGAVFSSRVFSTVNGQTNVIALWDSPLHQFDVAYGVKSGAQLDQIKQIFWLVRGQLHGFRYKDWNDYSFDFTRGQLIPVSTGVYQLAKLYTFGPISVLRKLLKLVVGTISLENGGVVIPSENYTIDYTTGLVTFGGTTIPASNAVLAAAGEFDVPVRFTTDQMIASIDDFDIQSWGQIPLMEIRFPGASIGIPTAPLIEYPPSLPAAPPASAPGPSAPSPSPSPAPGPSPAPSPAPARTNLATFNAPPTYGTLSNANLTLSHAAATYTKAQATANIGAYFSNTASPTAGFAAEFTVECAPAGQLHLWVGLNLTTYASQSCYYFNDDGYADGPGWTINSSLFANPGSSGSGGAWVNGDKIGIVVYANNDDASTASVAFFKNGTLIANGPISSDLSSPFYFAANVATGSGSNGGQISVKTNITMMTYASAYKAFRDGSFAMLDADSWGS